MTAIRSSPQAFGLYWLPPSRWDLWVMRSTLVKAPSKQAHWSAVVDPARTQTLPTRLRASEVRPTIVLAAWAALVVAPRKTSDNRYRFLSDALLRPAR